MAGHVGIGADRDEHRMNPRPETAGPDFAAGAGTSNRQQEAEMIDLSTITAGDRVEALAPYYLNGERAEQRVEMIVDRTPWLMGSRSDNDIRAVLSDGRGVTSVFAESVRLLNGAV